MRPGATGEKEEEKKERGNNEKSEMERPTQGEERNRPPGVFWSNQKPPMESKA
jgi:hypothetical protein